MPQIPAQRDDRLRRAETAAQQAEDGQVAQPFAVGHVTLSAGDIFHVAGVDQDDVEAARFKNLEHRDPVDPGRLHRHMRDPRRREPVGEPMQIAGEGGERTDRHRIAIRGNRDEMFGRPAIDAGGVRMQPFKGRR